MIVSFYSVCKGAGQTTTAINLGIFLSSVKGLKTVIVDLNSCNGDIKYHLSKARCIKGLGEYADLFEVHGSKNELLEGCIEAVSENLHILSNDHCIELSEAKINYLINYLSYKYDMILVDGSHNSFCANEILIEKAQCLITVLNQEKRMVEGMNSCSYLRKHASKTVFIVNKFIDKYNEKMVSYRIDKILKDMNDSFIKQKMFSLPFDIRIQNMSNDECLQGYVPSLSTDKTGYSKILHQLYEYLINPYELSMKKEKGTMYYCKRLVNWREKIKCLVN